MLRGNTKTRSPPSNHCVRSRIQLTSKTWPVMLKHELEICLPRFTAMRLRSCSHRKKSAIDFHSVQRCWSLAHMQLQQRLSSKPRSYSQVPLVRTSDWGWLITSWNDTRTASPPSYVPTSLIPSQDGRWLTSVLHRQIAWLDPRQWRCRQYASGPTPTRTIFLLTFGVELLCFAGPTLRVTMRDRRKLYRGFSGRIGSLRGIPLPVALLDGRLPGPIKPAKHATGWKFVWSCAQIRPKIITS